MWFKRCIFSMAMLTAGIACVGCNQKEKKADQVAKTEAKTTAKHDGWWCFEHGVPEHMCSICSDEVAAQYKKEGKWCKIHDRAEEQCFKCDPARYTKYEEMYVAKYGKKPKRPPEEEFQK